MAEETGQPGVPEAVRYLAGRGEQETGAEPGADGEPGTGDEPGAGPEPGTGAGHESDNGGPERDSRRAELIASAQARWISTLTDLGGRNTLLYYKDRRAGTLDLAGADPDALDRFCRTGSIRLTKLFHDVDA